EAEVDAVARAGLAGFAVDRRAPVSVAVAERVPVGRRRAGDVGKRDSVLVGEPRFAVVVEADRVAAFVDVAVVAAAEQDEVVEVRFAALAPMVEVVAVDETSVGAAGEAAAAVAGGERAAEGRCECASFAP